MKLPAVIILCSLALCGARGADFFGTPGSPTAPAAAASGSPWAFSIWNEDTALPTGNYQANGKKVTIAKDRKVAIGPGCFIEKTQFVGGRGIQWDVTGSFLRDVPFNTELGSKFKAVDSAFEDCSMWMVGAWFVDMWSTRWRFDNCVFAGKFMKTEEIDVQGGAVVADRSSFHDIELPKIRYKHDPADAAQSDKLRFLNCRFVKCEVPESFLAATVDCVFEDCQISVKREDWSKARRPINVTAYIVSRNKPPADFENGMLKVTFKTTAAPACGTTLRYTQSGGRLTSAMKPTGPAILIGNVENAPAAPQPAPSESVSPVAANPVTARIQTKDDLRNFLLATTWSWQRSDGPKEKIQFFADGTARHTQFIAKFETKNRSEVELRLGNDKAVLKFDPTYSRFDAIDFNGKRSVHGERENLDRESVAGTTAAPVPASTPVAAVSTPSDPVSRDLVKTHRNSLVFVTGADGSGSGFVASLGGATFLFTNAHVAAGIKGAGFKTLDGTTAQVGAPSIAVGHDIFRMQLGPGGNPMEIMLGVDEKVTIDDEIVVLGNAEGAGVINTIKGRVVGVGPQLVEVDAPFQPGNSGSPIIHLKTGKVIGVATYATIKKYDAATKEVLKAPVIRRFGYRLDNVKTWQPVNWPVFYAQAAEMQAVETLTGDLGNFLVDLGKDGKVTPGGHSNPAIKSRIDQWQADSKKRQSPKDAAQVDQNFISFLKVACRADITAAQQRITYDYFQRQLTKEQQERGEIADIFDKIIKGIQTGR